MTRHDSGPAAKVGRILVVEDSPSARRLLQDILLRLGAELPNLRVAGTVVEGLTLFTQWRPDLVFVDLELRPHPTDGLPSDGPKPSPSDPKNGAELAELFRRRNSSVRVILCSASDPADPRVASLVDAGQAEFIMKPLVAARVEEVLSRGKSVGVIRPRE
ncbi:MAG TPA: response regulator [Thermoplasmata archaeon]|nr:response regulator [Thermoplasmata archaeon]